jgi:hypothetical protein
MPVVRILKPTAYTPSADDSPRCYGQLRYRRTATVGTDGVKSFGKMTLHFPTGARPDLTNDVAQRLIDEGFAELTDEASPVFTDVGSLDAVLKEVAK